MLVSCDLIGQLDEIFFGISPNFYKCYYIGKVTFTKMFSAQTYAVTVSIEK